MFPPHAYFSALDFEAGAGTVFDIFFSQAGYGSSHSDSVIRAIFISIEYFVVRSKEPALGFIPGAGFRISPTSIVSRKYLIKIF